MATYRKRGKSWRAEIRLQGVTRSASFVKKADAIAWATEEETKIRGGTKGEVKDVTLAQLLDEYSERVTPQKKSKQWETRRLAFYARHDIAKKKLSELSPSDFAKLRDERLKATSSGTVNRDWNLLSNVFTVAIQEWGWLHDHPMKGVKRPKEAPPRDRIYTDDEIERLLFALGYDYNATPTTGKARVGAAMLFAVETAMRASEITGLTWDHVDLDKRVAKLIETKNGTVRRVPLSKEAIRILRQLPENDTVFGVSSSVLSAFFLKAKKAAMVEGPTFHDTRATAITRLAQKLDILDLARMTGHKDLRMLQIYYRKSAEDIAADLD